MQNMQLLRNELIKTKNSGILWLATLGCIVCNVMLAIVGNYLSSTEIELLNLQTINGWNDWIGFHYQGMTPMLLPMFLVILCALAISQEHRNNTWKVLYTMPIKRSSIYLSKQLLIVIVFAGSHLLFVLLMIFFPVLLNLSFDDGLPVVLLLELYLTTVVSSLGILGLIYLISYYSSSFVLPLAVGIIGFVLAQLIEENQLPTFWWPFTYPNNALNNLLAYQHLDFTTLLSSIIVLFVATLSGMTLSTRKSIVT
jgi:hypothetical protein